MKILLADDERGIRLTLSEDLEEAGHEVVAVEDGELAMKELGKQHFDCMISDVVMPKVDGMSLLRVRPKEQGKDRGLDHRFSWLAVPLPERGRHLCALAEVVHRRSYGPLEWVGVRFEQMSPSDWKLLDEYLSERDELSFGAAYLRMD